jgi:hypothetical protein
MIFDDFARLVTLGMSSGLLVVCGVVLWKARWAWRIILANALWGASLLAWVLTAIFMSPRDVALLNWWSRCNIWYSIVMVGMMLVLHYVVQRRSNGGGK